ncbi:penicillin acylase family protein [Bacillus suaedaesalsae]|uniref:Penicillin acylase family protein n=1 Tax=Bacillus suaedaesalsae TaxID=2810349 RepID=A0ABS2DHK3_9BACI|nr:penicillin acylase family protein [Bacillus suaedaesalsae]MBM6617023.1 penicillin acylase family protein [Bacillus suaedaesalsae]
METIVRKQFQLWPKQKKWRIVVSVILAFIFILLLASTFLFWFIQRSEPQIEGTLTIDGLKGEVVVYRDSSGVPHIEAQNQDDLFLAQGFVTAQDRIFQMDLSRRQASGMLSEVVGKQALDRDKFFRTLGLRRAAEKSYEVYSPEAKQALASYAKGVNLFIEQAKKDKKLPIEFTILGYEPSSWSEIDSLTIGKYMAFDLGGHWEGQAFRHYLLENFPQDKALELFPGYPKDGARVLQAINETDIDISKSFANAVIPNEWNGSNNWVVSGEKSESGFPLLADDPHLGLATPAIWYETHLKSPEINVSGVIFAGIPAIILGRNEHISWGVTNVGPDVQDLYIEKRNPENRQEFLNNDKWEKAEVVSEKIKIKGEETIDYEVLITRHGPIVSEFAHYGEAESALSMRWTALDPSTELEAVLMFSKAGNWEEFKEALTYFHTPAQNFVFADQDGTIAYRANGLIPIRKKGDSMVPVPGWTDEYEWEGFIPWEELPTIVNPEEGFISTANNKVVQDDYPYHITHTWAQPYRAQRIRDVLNSKEKLTVEDMQNLQFDHANLQAEEFVPIFLNELKKGKLREMDEVAITELESWDFLDSTDAAGPMIFHFWMEEISNLMFLEEIPKEMMKLFDGRAQVVDELLRDAINGNPGIWITEKGGLQNVLEKSLQNAVDRASKLQGENPSNWQWGQLHAVQFTHPLSSVTPLNYLFNAGKPLPMRGSRITVGAAGWDSETGEVEHGASWRSVVDMENPLQSYNVVGPGQSGHVTSDWYKNQMNDWVTGKYHVTSMNGEYKEEAFKLVLQPMNKE